MRSASTTPRPGSPTTRSRRGARRSAAVAVGLALAAALAGCGKEPVTIPTLRLSAADQAACQRVTSALPSTVAEQSRRKTQPAAAFGGAWGDPAIVVQCGVGVPDGFSHTASCQVANGVGWFLPDSQIDDSSADVVMSSAGYRPVVQVSLPESYRPNGVAAAMVEVGAVVKKYTKLVKPCH